MAQPIELPDELIRDARVMAEASQRSIADQIELWAHLGRALEPLLGSGQIVALQKGGSKRTLSQAIREATTEAGQQRVRDYLQTQPFPHFESVPGSPGLLRKIDADGTVTVGKFVNRVFVPVEE